MLDSELHNESDNGSAAEPAAPAAPAAVFQAAPQVLFQPPPVAPAPASPPGSKGSPAASKAPPSAGKAPPSAGKASPPAAAKPARAAKTAKPSQPAETAVDDDSADEGEETSGRRRRRRSTRTRGGKAESAEPEAPSDASEPEPGKDSAGEKATPVTDESGETDSDVASGEDGQEPGSASGRRRRRKRRRGGADGETLSPDDPPDTVVHVREAPSPADSVRAIKGSTRLEAKKQRRREGRESGRRRPPVVTESEFLARRESVERVMVVRQRGERTQIAVLEDGVLVEHYVNRTSHQSYVGNVYLGKVQNVLPSMEAAFVDIGKGRNAVLYAGEVNFDASGLEGQPKRIESALKPGQSVIVQVTKDPVGHKGARLTSMVSLPGRYLVYVPGASMTGISRKLPDTERNRLKQILKKVMPENGGVIVRTAAEGAAEEELSRDVSRLAAQWENIEKKSHTASAPALLYSEPDLTIRVVRDVFNEDFSKLIVSGEEDWDVIDEYVRYVAPHLADRLTRWSSSSEDVFGAYRIDEQIAKALERKVWLPSGGSLVIDRTEAMTVVDVNTGKFTGQGGNLEETVTRNNLEAAEEIVRQLRLRDVGGIVVIDFIDMVLESNRELVLRRLLECLARDRTKHQVAEVTSLGLVQMTRKRVGAGLLEAFSETCDCCNGRGVVITLDPAGDSSSHHHRAEAGSGSGSGSGKDRSNGRSRNNGHKPSEPQVEEPAVPPVEEAPAEEAPVQPELVPVGAAVTASAPVVSATPPASGGRRTRGGTATVRRASDAAEAPEVTAAVQVADPAPEAPAEAASVAEATSGSEAAPAPEVSTPVESAPAPARRRRRKPAAESDPVPESPTQD